jgi:cytochrome c
MPLSEEGFRACVDCHTTQFAASERVPGPEAADHGIGCERCHGPGDNHIRAVESGFPQLAIARPKLATPAQRVALCGQCHSADGETPPSDPRFVRFQATTLAYSRCVTESGGRLDFVACHNPHRNVETSPARYEARCLSCHGGNKPPKEPTTAVRAAHCPVNAKANCLNCHMPKVENVLPFTSFTDHHIRVHRTESKVGSPGPAR